MCDGPHTGDEKQYPASVRAVKGSFSVRIVSGRTHQKTRGRKRSEQSKELSAHTFMFLTKTCRSRACGCLIMSDSGRGICVISQRTSTKSSQQADRRARRDVKQWPLCAQ